MSTTWDIKTLRLMPAQRAVQFGIPAEAPVFVSPVVTEQHECHICQQPYTPLLFQAGYVTTAQHYHPDGGCGGIYFYRVESPHVLSTIAERSAWLTGIIPLGRIAIGAGSGYAVGRAEKVLCTQMSAWCMRHTSAVSSVLGASHSQHLLTEGLLFQHPCYKEPAINLLPLCDQGDLPAAMAPLRFQVLDGTVCFLRREQWPLNR